MVTISPNIFPGMELVVKPSPVIFRISDHLKTMAELWKGQRQGHGFKIFSIEEITLAFGLWNLGEHAIEASPGVVLGF